MKAELQSRIINGEVMHKRHHPVQNTFTYSVFALLLNVDELEQLDSWLFAVNKSRPLSFSFKDYGDGSHPRQWVMALLAKHNIHHCSGDLWVQTFPRVMGYLFNPVSFWYCCDEHGEVGAIIAEVNNTFGEHHCYLLTPDPQNGQFKDLRHNKQFFVSPFYPVEGEYRFNFNLDFSAPRVSIDYFQQGTLQLNTAIWGEAKPLTRKNITRSLIKQPLLTISVMVKIHWQALRLLFKRVPLVEKPTAKFEEI